jgi:hypothetical protein
MEAIDKNTNTSCGSIDSCRACLRLRWELAKLAGIRSRLCCTPCFQRCFALDGSPIFQDRLRLTRGVGRNRFRCRHSPGFQQDLAAFIARNNHNLSYASFFPVFSVGFGYAF